MNRIINLLSAMIMKRKFFALLTFFCFQSMACQLDIPTQKEFKLSTDENCSLTIKNKKDYMTMSFYKTRSISITELFSTDEISKSNDDFYLPYEFVDDANYTINPKNHSPLRKLTKEPEIWKSISTVYVSAMPKKQVGRSDSFALTLACLDIVGGDARRSFVTRYCQPRSKKHLQKEFNLYLDLVEKIRVVEVAGRSPPK